jgi:DNA-binding NarL/FixJ family response regulator
MLTVDIEPSFILPSVINPSHARILLSPMNILIADQDPLFRQRLKRRLEKITGVAVIGETAEAEATTVMIVNRKPDIIILDIDLKNGSGIEVLRHIKHLIFHPTVIIVTNQPCQELRSACAVAGEDFFFDKAIEDRKVVTTVRLLCDPGPEQDLSDPTEALPD